MKFTVVTSLATLSACATLVSAQWDLSKKNNFMAYWGQNGHGAYAPEDPAELQQQRLIEYCKNPNIDAFTIGFVNWWDPQGKNLVINVSNACTGDRRFPDQEDLLWCPTIQEDIIACQKQYGKKIFMSIGGGFPGEDSKWKYDGFTANQHALDTAYLLWRTFGGGWTYYRPFGEAVVDGFDLNLEYGTNTRYHELARVLRRLMDADKTKQWFLTASPQCNNPDYMLAEAIQRVKFDALFIQFYNNEKCMAANWKSGKSQDTNDGFNFGMWHNWVQKYSANRDVKLFLGTVMNRGLAWNPASYISRTQVVNVAKDIKKYSSFAGVSTWDVSESHTNTGFIGEIKKGLNSIQGVKKRDGVSPVVSFLRRRHLHHRKF